MHKEMEFYLSTVRNAVPKFFANVSVLEIGSYNVNGSVRKFFNLSKEYVGVDIIAGPDVDIVAQGQDIKLNRQFDVAISTECFEHTPHYEKILENMVIHTKRGGLVLFTCASTGRPEHGTSRAKPVDSPGTIAEGSEYYRNLEARHFDRFPFSESFVAWHFFYNQISHDLYFIGSVKPETKNDWPAVFKTIADAILPTQTKIRRVALCPCGSGERFKHCHGRL